MRTRFAFLFPRGGVIAVAALGLFAGATLAFGQGASYKVVAFTGQAAPGGGVYSDFGLPKLGAEGTVAFIDGFDGEGGTPKVVASRFGRDRLVAKQGQTAPVSGGVFQAFTNVSVAKDGRVAYKGTIGRGEELATGLWGEKVGFSVADTLSTFGPMGFRAGTFFGVKAMATVDAESSVGVLAILDEKGTSNAVVEGQSLPGPSGNVLVTGLYEASESGSFYPGSQAGTEVDANESGVLALKVVTTPGPSPTPGTVQRIYTGTAKDLKWLASEGEAAPGLAETFLEDLSPMPAIASNGLVAFSARLSGAVGSAVYAGQSGALRLIVKATDSVPTTVGVTFDDVFAPVVINKTGDVIFKATIRYPNESSREGIWIQRRSGRPVLIATSGIQLPTPAGLREVTDVDFAGPGTFNDLHQFVFRASFATGQGIYVADTRAVAPWVRALFPRKPRDRVTRERSMKIRGMALDVTGVEKVEYTVVREGKSRRKAIRPLTKIAKGGQRWSFDAPLAIGINRIRVTATDKLGNVSEPLVLRILRY